MGQSLFLEGLEAGADLVEAADGQVHVIDEVKVLGHGEGADGSEVGVHRLGHVALELTGTAHAYLCGNLLRIATGADARRGEQGRDARAVLGVERDDAVDGPEGESSYGCV